MQGKLFIKKLFPAPFQKFLIFLLLVKIIWEKLFSKKIFPKPFLKIFHILDNRLQTY